MKKQAFNPYLPSYEYIPDGEPHVFGDRIYLYGSHDRFGSAGFCLNDYVCYSADVKDLTDWKYEGVIYRKDQDPVNRNIPEDAPEQKLTFGITPEKEEDLNPRGVHAMWAPDVVRGPDGRYYLFYCMDFLPQIRVAVCGTPAGKYEYLGMVKHADGTILGEKEGDLEQFDPGVFVDDDGGIYLYSGNAPIKAEYDRGVQGSQVMRLEPDMLTLKEEPRRLMPDILNSKGTGFEGHEFFEASSIRKINGKYYFVYSSVNSSELCYAVSSHPDRGYTYGGTLVDIGDIGLNGRTREDAVNALGNTHGGIECADGQWYIFYHRQTARTNFSRQGCAEKIFFDEDGKIAQAEVTSCGMNKGPLVDEGTYPARICCHLTGKKGVTYSHPLAMKMDYPFLTQDGKDIDPESEEAEQETELPLQYICNIQDGTVIGYKYFRFGEENGAGDVEYQMKVRVRGNAEGTLYVQTTPAKDGKDICGSIRVDADTAASADSHTEGESARTDGWSVREGTAKIPAGIHPLYFRYEGTGGFDMVTFTLNKK